MTKATLILQDIQKHNKHWCFSSESNTEHKLICIKKGCVIKQHKRSKVNGVIDIKQEKDKTSDFLPHCVFTCMCGVVAWILQPGGELKDS